MRDWNVWGRYSANTIGGGRAALLDLGEAGGGSNLTSRGIGSRQRFSLPSSGAYPAKDPLIRPGSKSWM